MTYLSLICIIYIVFCNSDYSYHLWPTNGGNGEITLLYITLGVTIFEI